MSSASNRSGKHLLNLTISRSSLKRISLGLALALLIGLFAFVSPFGNQGGTAQAAAVLTIEQITWSIVGLDSNDEFAGPNEFPVGVRVCNVGDAPTGTLTADFNFTTPNSYISLVPFNLPGIGSATADSGTQIYDDPLPQNSCLDIFFSVQVTRDNAAYDATRSFIITVTDTGPGGSSASTGQQLYVESLVSQNRNATRSITGPSSVLVGQQYTWTVDAFTATNGYEELEHFLTFCPDVYRLDSVTTSYTAPRPFTDDMFWADGCAWNTQQNGIGTPNNNGCTAPAIKYGGDILYQYNVTIVGAGTCTLRDMVYDFSGSSFHYNSDYPNVSLTVTASYQVCFEGTVFKDTIGPDNDTVDDNTVEGVPNFTVIAYLDDGDGVFEPAQDLIASNAITDGAGPSQGDYQACVPQGSRYFLDVNTGDPQVSGFTLEGSDPINTGVIPSGSSNTTVSGQDFDFNPALSGTGTISGTVYGDFGGAGAGNNQYDPGLGESGIGGVVLTVYRDVDNDGIFEPGGDDNGSLATATTSSTPGSEGQYSVNDPDLTTGNYWVVAPSSATGGLTIGTANPLRVSVTAGQDTPNQNFGYDQPPAGGTNGTVSGTVYLDTNPQNDTYDGDGVENGINSVTITIYNDVGNDGVCTSGTDDVVAQQVTQVTTTTAGGFAGKYSASLPAGQYCIVAPPSADDGGTPRLIGTTRLLPVTVTSGGTVNNQDFGYDPVAAGTILIRVFKDIVTTNGTWDAGEPFVADLLVGVRRNDVPRNTTPGVLPDDPLEGTQLTLAGGYSAFTGLMTTNPADDYFAVVCTSDICGVGNNTALPPGFTLPFNFVRVQNLGGYPNDTASIDFPLQPSGTVAEISGTVYVDDNPQNDTFDGTGVEAGLQNVTVQLQDDTAGGTIIAATITDANGNYSFPGIPTGRDYTIIVEPAGAPAGYTPGTPTSLTLTGLAGNSAGNNFGFDPPAGGGPSTGSISGTVFDDADASGTLDPGETGIGSVSVTLYLDDGDSVLGPGDTLVGTTATLGTGAYSFTSLAAGNYLVVESDPAGYVSTTSNVLVQLLGPGASVTDLNFGDRQPSTNNAISGTVFNDLNGNGVQDPGEPGLSGVTVTLQNSFGTTLATTTTDGSGNYSFTGLVDGSYIVVETDPTGFTSTTSNTSGANLAGGATATIDFGDQLRPGIINGTVFNDNGAGGGTASNGTQDPGSSEPGIGSVTVSLYRDVNGDGLLDPGDTLVGLTTTNTSGFYQFINLAPYVSPVSDPASPPAQVEYLVVETDPSGYVSTTPNLQQVTVNPGQTTTQNFGDLFPPPPGTVLGAVWNDLDGDGLRDIGEPGIAGVQVELRDSLNNPVGTATTDGGGNYSFSSVTPGDYSVVETDPAGYTSTTPNTVNITVPSGGTAIAEFGDQANPGTISGTVTDVSVPDGLPDVVITLYKDTNGNGVLDPGVDTIIDITTTDPNGDYTFTNVPPGAYIVAESDPTGYVSVTPNEVAVNLPANGSETADFEDTPVVDGTISGIVWNDLNGDGIRDPGEPGIGGVTVQLRDAAGTTILATTSTDAGGNYAFTGVSAGNYTVVENDPIGYTSTTSNSVPVSISLATPSATADFGDQQDPGAVGGTVWNDINSNGVINLGEPPLSGVTVSIYSDVNNNGLFDPGVDVLATVGMLIADPGDPTGPSICSDPLTQPGPNQVVTGASGVYSFPCNPPGSYLIVESDPPGYVSTTTNVAQVVIAPGNSQIRNFGDTNSPPAGTLYGAVFDDPDSDGIFDPGETGIPGVSVVLQDSNGNTILSTFTDGSGSFNFTGLSNGDYRLVESDPPGYVSTTANNVGPITLLNNSAFVNFGDRLRGQGGGGDGGGIISPVVTFVEPPSTSQTPLLLLPDTGLRPLWFRLAGPMAAAVLGITLLGIGLLATHKGRRKHQ